MKKLFLGVAALAVALIAGVGIGLVSAHLHIVRDRERIRCVGILVSHDQHALEASGIAAR